MIFDLIPLPDIISDAILVNELLRYNPDVKTFDLFVPALIILIISIIVNAIRIKRRWWHKDAESHKLAGATFLGTVFLEDIPQSVILTIYINRKLEVDEDSELTFAQGFSLIASAVTIFACGYASGFVYARSSHNENFV
eukprot:CAMPEP_0194385624 /NCGR_PEP_ID=MMETSP0174-20130528/81331_1 /TAXON_ID=216777 /ORGANISM="Proboscia alata, Strain PI-D3" /LENGTH=138 /DNA_ID=CAMNT_0039173923 /DNA_START=34 /DNA_END=447 /DNA_ORIENTATION=-